MLQFQNKLESSLKSRVFLEKNVPRARLKSIRTIHHTYILVMHLSTNGERA